jgi:hypothetical protein
LDRIVKPALLVAVTGAAVLAGVATALNPKSLVLRRADVPAGAKRVSFGTSRGAIKIPRTVRGQAAYVGWKFKNRGATENVAAAAGILKTARDAHDILVHLKRTFKRTGVSFKTAKLPKYGDEQFGAFAGASGLGSALVFVRSGTRLWEVVVYGYPRFTRARTIAELKKYAVKEKARAT